MSDSSIDWEQYVPQPAMAYCARLHQQHGFLLRLSRPRRSKWGDYRYRRQGRTACHAISVNKDLNPYAFLITYLHEVAHLVAFQQHGLQIKPHGAAWQRCFQQLLQPVLTSAVFPPALLTQVRRVAKNPRAAVGSDSQLSQALSVYDTRPGVPLSRLSPSTSFLFRNHIYIKVKTRRTRALCQRVANNQRYLIQETAQVEPIPSL